MTETNDSGTQTEDVQIGDRVDLRLHGATSTNHAKGTVVETDVPGYVPGLLAVRLDKDHKNCDKRYETPAESINHIIGDE